MAKEILYDDDARNGLAAGIHKLSDAVKVTLGPRGRYVALQGPRRSPTITNDGVTVAKAIQLKNQVENMGARMVREAAIRTNDIAGDGTTTATLLTDVIVTEGLRLIASGAEALALRRGIDKGVKAVVAALAEDATDVKTKDEVANIAYISSGDEKIAEVIAEAVDAMGSTGGITCQDGVNHGVEVEIVKGIRYEEGYILHSMVTDEEHNIAELENPLILITDQELMSIQPLVPLLEQVVQAKRDLFIISNDVRGEARRTIMLNTERGTFRTVATECPDFNEQRKLLLQDIATCVGATPILEEFGFHWPDVTIDMLGSADRVRCTAHSTVITGGHGDPQAVEDRINQIQGEIDRTVNPVFIEKLEQRMQKMRGGVAIIRLGAASDAELKEMKSRVEDALCAVTAAMDEGILPGGGVALVNAARVLDDLDVPSDEQLGVDIVRKACMTPLATIAQNCGYEGPVEIDKVQNMELGYGRNYKTGEIGNMVEMGVIDPVLVTRYALEAAASVGGLVLITETTTNKLLVGDERMPDEPLQKSKGVMRM